MNRSEPFVITISREIGSGGRSVAQMLAARLQVRFSDKYLINALVEKFHLSVPEIERIKGEKKHWLAGLIDMVAPIPNSGAFIGFEQRLGEDWNRCVSGEDVFQAECEILRALASEGSCVVAGRTGFYVLRDFPNRLDVFIRAPRADRVQRVMDKQGIPAEQAGEIIDSVDESRENYVKQYTGRSRYDLRNYDLVINMDGITEEEAVDLILQYIG